MSFPRVTILCPELATNALARALLLARLLPAEARAEIVGFRQWGPVWGPARDAGVPIRDLPLTHLRELPAARRWLREQVRGEVLLVSKALPTSLGLALAADLPGVRLALDIDDWEYGLSLPHDGSRPGVLKLAASAAVGMVRRGQPNSVAATWLCERLVSRVPARIVSNRWLARRFGGTLLPHVRDGEALDPSVVSGESVRAKLELDRRTWVGFVGTVRAHKGVRDLVSALAKRRDAAAPGLLLLGTDPGDPVVADLVAHARAALGTERLRVRRQFALSELPEYVAAADVVAIPSRDAPQSRGQIPAKLFDAMAMAKPVVATALNDVPEVLDGCGLTVPAGDPGALAEAIAKLDDPGLRRELGRAARERLLDRYSYASGRRVLREFVGGLA